jgi:hypothetical protein
LNASTMASRIVHHISQLVPYPGIEHSGPRPSEGRSMCCECPGHASRQCPGGRDLAYGSIRHQLSRVVTLAEVHRAHSTGGVGEQEPQPIIRLTLSRGGFFVMFVFFMTPHGTCDP